MNKHIKNSNVAPDERINSEFKTSLFAISNIRALQHSWGERDWGLSGPPPPKAEFKNTDFVDTMISKVLRDLRFDLNHPLKSADD